MLLTEYTSARKTTRKERFSIVKWNTAWHNNRQVRNKPTPTNQRPLRGPRPSHGTIHVVAGCEAKRHPLLTFSAKNYRYYEIQKKSLDI